jgi:hypothetical protein
VSPAPNNARAQTTNLLLECGELALLTSTQNIPKLAPLM